MSGDLSSLDEESQVRLAAVAQQTTAVGGVVGPAGGFRLSLKFYGVGVSQPVTRALICNGAEEARFMSDDVTHIIVGTHMHKDQNVANFSELYSQAVVVDESWAISSIMLQSILNPTLFSPKSMAFFEGLIVSFSGISPEDRRKLWFVMSHFGALCLIFLDSRCNLLISGNSESVKYNKAMKMSDRISVVCPDWVIACLTKGRLEPIEPYHPKNLVRSPVDNFFNQQIPTEQPVIKEEPQLTLGLSSPLKDPSILELSNTDKNKTSTTKKTNSKFVKANIQFFHSGHGAPPALADREKKKQASLLNNANQLPCTRAPAGSGNASNMAKSPATPVAASEIVKSEPQIATSTNTQQQCPTPVKSNKPKRIIRLARKRPLHFQNEAKPEKRLYDFLKLNKDVDNRVPPECCRRGCKFLVNDVKKFLSNDVLKAVKDFLSGNNFDCSCPCHFLSTSLINDINCQGAWLDAESNPRIRALLDLQQLVASVPQNHQTEFLQNTFYSPNESNPNKSNVIDVQPIDAPLDVTLDVRCEYPPKSIQDAPIDQKQPSSLFQAQELKVEVSLKDESNSPANMGKMKTRSSKVNPALNALYSKYTSEILPIEGRVVMKFKKVKSKSEDCGDLTTISGEPSASASSSADMHIMKCKGTCVEIFWDEKQLRGTGFVSGWYNAIVNDYKTDTDHLIVQDVIDVGVIGKCYKIPFKQLLSENKLRLSLSDPQILTGPNCSNSTTAMQVAANSMASNGVKSEPSIFDNLRNIDVSFAPGVNSVTPSAITVQTSSSHSMTQSMQPSNQISPAAFVNMSFDQTTNKSDGNGLPVHLTTTNQNLDPNSCLQMSAQLCSTDQFNSNSVISNGNLPGINNPNLISNQSMEQQRFSFTDSEQVNNQMQHSKQHPTQFVPQLTTHEQSTNGKQFLPTNHNVLANSLPNCFEGPDPGSANLLMPSNMLLQEIQQHATPSVCSDYFSESGIDDTPINSLLNSNIAANGTNCTNSNVVKNNLSVHNNKTSPLYERSDILRNNDSSMLLNKPPPNLLPHHNMLNNPASLSATTKTQALHCVTGGPSLQANMALNSSNINSISTSSSRLPKAQKTIGFDDLSSDDESEKGNESGVENDDDLFKKNALSILDNLKMC